MVCDAKRRLCRNEQADGMLAHQSAGSFKVIELDSRRHRARACWANGDRYGA
jgi:hypothetical protein